MLITDQAISLARFIDFVVKSGSPKLTSVKDTKSQLADGYHPARDYWKIFREAVADMHRKGHEFSSLLAMAETVSDKKTENYKIRVAGYKKFYRTIASYAWAEPPAAVWDAGRLQVRVNPELGFESASEHLVVKMVCSKSTPKFHQREIDTILHLLRTALDYESDSGVTYAVLDVTTGKLFKEKQYDESVTALLRGEAESFATMFELV